MTINPESTQFGEDRVTPEEKTARVRGVFDSVAEKYDLMNDLMSGGVHRLWKDHLIRKIRPRPGLHYLDVAGGTGDIAFRIQRTIEKKNNPPPDFSLRSKSPSPPERGRGPAKPDGLCREGEGQTKITLCDLNFDMLRVGRNRAIDKGWLNDFDWITGNAENLPLPSGSVDVYIIAFGLRNVTRIDDALKDAIRVLKPGGRFYCLEFSTIDNPLAAKAYDMFSYGLIPRLGRWVASDTDSYRYLIDSIRKFPDQAALKKRMERAGLSNCTYENLTLGVAAIHNGIKL